MYRISFISHSNFCSLTRACARIHADTPFIQLLEIHDTLKFCRLQRIVSPHIFMVQCINCRWHVTYFVFDLKHEVELSALGHSLTLTATILFVLILILIHLQRQFKLLVTILFPAFIKGLSEWHCCILAVLPLQSVEYSRDQDKFVYDSFFVVNIVTFFLGKRSITHRGSTLCVLCFLNILAQLFQSLMESKNRQNIWNKTELSRSFRYTNSGKFTYTIPVIIFERGLGVWHICNNAPFQRKLLLRLKDGIYLV